MVLRDRTYALAVGVLAFVVHGAIALVGILAGGCARTDYAARGRAVVYLETTRSGRLLRRALRWMILPLVVLAIWCDFIPPDDHVAVQRYGTALLFGAIAIIAPLVLAFLSYKRWLLIVLGFVGAAEILQASPVVPGEASLLDLLAVAGVVLTLALTGVYGRWLNRQDFEDMPLWARPWSTHRSKLGLRAS